jgi:hypothetical protein
MKIVALLALLATTVVGCTNGNPEVPAPTQLNPQSRPNSQPRPHSLWEFLLVNHRGRELIADSHHSKCMSKEFPSTDLPAVSHVGAVVDTDRTGLCAFKSSSFVITYHYILRDAKSSILDIIYTLPLRANRWEVAEWVDGKKISEVTVGAPVETFCHDVFKYETTACDVSQRRP